MTSGSVSWLGLDVGGANIKAAHSSGLRAPRRSSSGSVPTTWAASWPRWRARFPAHDRVALTMTAELCDCYPTKAVGVEKILDAIVDVFAGASGQRLGD